jgi:hypothetical protein
MQDGLVAEFDSPARLLQNPDSAFSRMVDQARASRERAARGPRQQRLILSAPAQTGASSAEQLRRRAFEKEGIAGPADGGAGPSAGPEAGAGTAGESLESPRLVLS